MELTNIGGYKTVGDFVQSKINTYRTREKTMETLFELMFSEQDNVMAEISDGYRIKKFTYGQIKSEICAASATAAALLSDVEQGGIVGLHMSNSINWIKVFWLILICGYRPLLMNTSFSDELLEGIIAEQGVCAVISDGRKFSVTTVSSEEATAVSEKAPIARRFGEEVLFMSSGTTERVKLSAYNGENFFYQVCDSYNIINQCPSIATHYNGELKQLALLPFYHVFGFIAVYLWFGFFSRSFVFLKDLNPTTIQNTIKKHNVTHFFAVPSVFERVHAAALSKIRSRGGATYKKFTRALRISNSLGKGNIRFARIALKEVRESLFGDSVSFLISGGGGISSATLAFFNGIGYHLANGYGMTEIGITSVEKSDYPKQLIKASIGSPFGYTEYKTDEEGQLFVKGHTRAARIIVGNEVIESDYDEWFATGDIVRYDGERYYHLGRIDDLVIGADGENLNPTIIEPMLTVEGCDGVALIADSEDRPVLIVSVRGCFSLARLDGIFDALTAAVSDARLDRVVRKILITPDGLVESGEFKISRKRIRRRFLDGSLKVIEQGRTAEHIETALSELDREIIGLFAEALGRDATEIASSDHFFRDLGGTSLDYFMLLDLIKTKYAVEIGESTKEGLYSPSDFSALIRSAK